MLVQMLEQENVTVKWERPLKQRSMGEMAQGVSVQMVATGGKLYAVNEKGVVFIVDISKPQGEIVSQLDLGQTILCTPAIANGALYLRSDTKLWKLAKPATP